MNKLGKLNAYVNSGVSANRSNTAQEAVVQPTIIVPESVELKNVEHVTEAAHSHEAPQSPSKRNIHEEASTETRSRSQTTSNIYPTNINDFFDLLTQLNNQLVNVGDVCKTITAALGNANDGNRAALLDRAGKECLDFLTKRGSTTKEMVRFLRIELGSTFGVFKGFIGSGYSDIIITQNSITLISHIRGKEEFEIPESLSKIYEMLVEHMIDNVMFTSGKKFDPGNAILDAQMEGVRFNVTHKCLNTLREFPVVIMRAQVIASKDSNKSIIDDEEKYLGSIGASGDQRRVLEECAVGLKNFIIFGTTGSGKTVLLKYLCNKHLDKKPNLCTIEDTPELFIPTKIAMKTNETYSIKELFKAALRQAPSNLVIGETRTEDIIDILEAGLAFNIGSTIHAQSLQKAIERIFFMALPRKIDRESVMSLIYSSVDVFIYMDKLKLRGIWERDNSKSPDFNNLSSFYKEVQTYEIPYSE